MQDSSATLTFGAKHRLSAFTILSLVLFCLFAALDPDTANTVTIGARNIVTRYFDWLFVATVSGVLLLTIGLEFHPNASRRIGRAEEAPCAVVPSTPRSS